MSNDWNIKDDEIRVIGAGASSEGKRRGKSWWVWILAVAALILLAAIILRPGPQESADTDEPGLFESGEMVSFTEPEADAAKAVTEAEMEVITPFGSYPDTADIAYTECIRRTINDIPMVIYIPHNATPELCLRAPDYRNKGIVLAAQAADIRRDNKEIVGSFVLKGELFSRGLSKKGYCSIIDGKLTLGVAENTPLFEQATETDGYFFRQYPLVDNGTLVENEIKNKALRKALCERAGEVFVVGSESVESFHDFSQALVDLGVENAIYLVGGTSYGFWHDKDGNVEEFSDHRISRYKYESYILWRAAPK